MKANSFQFTNLFEYTRKTILKTKLQRLILGGAVCAASILQFTSTAMANSTVNVDSQQSSRKFGSYGSSSRHQRIFAYDRAAAGTAMSEILAVNRSFVVSLEACDTMIVSTHGGDFEEKIAAIRTALAKRKSVILDSDATLSGQAALARYSTEIVGASFSAPALLIEVTSPKSYQVTPLHPSAPDQDMDQSKVQSQSNRAAAVLGLHSAK